MKPRVSYLICCVPRTGSWLLAESLHSTGIAGRPREYFAPEVQHNFLSLWGMPPGSGYADYVGRVIREATTQNGVLGIKVHWYQFNDLMQQLRSLQRLRDLPEECLLNEAIPNLRYIHLSRRDKVRQVVSYARACETKLWWEIDSSVSLRRRVLAKTPRFDVDRLDRLFQLIVEHERAWRWYFGRCGITPFTVFYEDLADDLEATIGRILKYLEIPVPENLGANGSRLKKQADDLSELWVQQYRQIRRSRQTMERLT